VDEFSQVGNEDMQWLLDYQAKNNSPLVFWGDGKQYQGISRGDPISDLIKENRIDYRQLTEIYRQQEPRLLAAAEHAAENRFQESVDIVKDNGWFITEENENKTRARLVEDLVGFIRSNEPKLAIAHIHVQGEQITRETRAGLKEEELLGKDDYEMLSLKPKGWTNAEKSDAINYAPEIAVKFHQRAVGGFKPGPT
jgi:ATP-dependent exoDNAse (exonuclease V) alpha subunit